MADTPAVTTDLDVTLLAGFGFACRPDCGLCCYAEPRVLAAERARLIQIAPEVHFVGTGTDQFIASHGDGGGCELLSDNRCGAHGARPHPCREFPLTAHVGQRLQVTVVLSCPGVDFSVLGTPRTGTRATSSGFTEELAALRERMDASTARRLENSQRRRRKIVRFLSAESRWQEETDVRAEVERSLPLPTAEDFPVPEPPTADEGLSQLPLFFDGRAAPVALAEGLGGWELLELSPQGGVARSLGIVPPPDRMPSLTAEATRLLQGYLRYWLRRDALFGAVHVEMLRVPDGRTVRESVEQELREIGALVLARAEVRAKLRRDPVDRLSAVDLADGIRATDQDLLDRDSWGDRF
jgi:Fe-S-cluster containining protein